MDEEKTPIQKLLIEIWADSARLQKKVDALDNFQSRMTPDKKAAREKLQAQLDWWRFSNLGELMNLFDLPPEDRE